MEEFYQTRENINQDIDQVFKNIYIEFTVNYSSLMEKNLSNADLYDLRINTNNYILETVNYKKILILDTLLNYLTDDARQILEGYDYDNKTINAFYDENRNWIKTIRNRFHDTTANNSFSLVTSRFSNSAFPRDAKFLELSLLWAMVLEKLDEISVPLDLTSIESVVYILGSAFITFLFIIIRTGVKNILSKLGLSVLIILISKILISKILRLAYRSYKKTKPEAKQNIQKDVKRYLEESQAQTQKELEKIMSNYIKDFQDFLNSQKHQFIENRREIK